MLLRGVPVLGRGGIVHLLASFLVRGGLDRVDLGLFGIGGGGAMLHWEEGLCKCPSYIPLPSFIVLGKRGARTRWLLHLLDHGVGRFPRSGQPEKSQFASRAKSASASA